MKLRRLFFFEANGAERPEQPMAREPLVVQAAREFWAREPNLGQISRYPDQIRIVAILDAPQANTESHTAVVWIVSELLFLLFNGNS